MMNDNRQFTNLPAIPYRAALFPYIGSVNAVVLLNQMIYWWTRMKRVPFYKFRSVCPHPDYRPGDSWIEEMGGWSLKKFDNARDRIATRLDGPGDLEGAIEQACLSDLPWIIPTERGTVGGASRGLIFYYEDNYHRTFYIVNDRLLGRLLEQLPEDRFTSRTEKADWGPVATDQPSTDDLENGPAQISDDLANEIQAATGEDVNLSEPAHTIAQRLQEAGYTTIDVRKAREIWHKRDWRGRKGEPMPLSEVLRFAGLARAERREWEDTAEGRYN